ncbi:hypothetical protein HY948_02140, partial [Candidatus Gottesmanbacteria bacterium]|nr:hypothetical protein [Candidatus Gottesmanbacteria bacterium]
LRAQAEQPKPIVARLKEVLDRLKAFRLESILNRIERLFHDLQTIRISFSPSAIITILANPTMTKQEDIVGLPYHITNPEGITVQRGTIKKGNSISLPAGEGYALVTSKFTIVGSDVFAKYPDYRTLSLLERNLLLSIFGVSAFLFSLGFLTQMWTFVENAWAVAHPGLETRTSIYYTLKDVFGTGMANVILGQFRDLFTPVIGFSMFILKNPQFARGVSLWLSLIAMNIVSFLFINLEFQTAEAMRRFVDVPDVFAFSVVPIATVLFGMYSARRYIVRWLNKRVASALLIIGLVVPFVPTALKQFVNLEKRLESAKIANQLPAKQASDDDAVDKPEGTGGGGGGISDTGFDYVDGQSYLDGKPLEALDTSGGQRNVYVLDDQRVLKVSAWQNNNSESMTELYLWTKFPQLRQYLVPMMGYGFTPTGYMYAIEERIQPVVSAGERYYINLPNYQKILPKLRSGEEKLENYGLRSQDEVDQLEKLYNALGEAGFIEVTIRNESSQMGRTATGRLVLLDFGKTKVDQKEIEAFTQAVGYRKDATTPDHIGRLLRMPLTESQAIGPWPMYGKKVIHRVEGAKDTVNVFINKLFTNPQLYAKAPYIYDLATVIDPEKKKALYTPWLDAVFGDEAERYRLDYDVLYDFLVGVDNVQRYFLVENNESNTQYTGSYLLEKVLEQTLGYSYLSWQTARAESILTTIFPFMNWSYTRFQTVLKPSSYAFYAPMDPKQIFFFEENGSLGYQVVDSGEQYVLELKRGTKVGLFNRYNAWSKQSKQMAISDRMIWLPTERVLSFDRNNSLRLAGVADLVTVAHELGHRLLADVTVGVGVEEVQPNTAFRAIHEGFAISVEMELQKYLLLHAYELGLSADEKDTLEGSIAERTQYLATANNAYSHGFTFVTRNFTNPNGSLDIEGIYTWFKTLDKAKLNAIQMDTVEYSALLSGVPDDYPKDLLSSELISYGTSKFEEVVSDFEKRFRPSAAGMAAAVRTAVPAAKPVAYFIGESYRAPFMEAYRNLFQHPLAVSLAAGNGWMLGDAVADFLKTTNAIGVSLGRAFVAISFLVNNHLPQQKIPDFLSSQQPARLSQSAVGISLSVPDEFSNMPKDLITGTWLRIVSIDPVDDSILVQDEVTGTERKIALHEFVKTKSGPWIRYDEHITWQDYQDETQHAARFSRIYPIEDTGIEGSMRPSRTVERFLESLREYEQQRFFDDLRKNPRRITDCLSDAGIISRVYAAGSDGNTGSCPWLLRSPWKVVGDVLSGQKGAAGGPPPPPVDEYEKELQKRYQRIALLAFLASILRSSDPCSQTANYYDQLKESLYESTLGFYKFFLSNVYVFDTFVNNNPSFSDAIKRSFGYFGSVGQCKTVGQCVTDLWGAAKKSTADLSAGAGLSALVPSNKPKKELPGNPNYKPYLEIIKKATSEYLQTPGNKIVTHKQKGKVDEKWAIDFLNMPGNMQYSDEYCNDGYSEEEHEKVTVMQIIIACEKRGDIKGTISYIKDKLARDTELDRNTYFRILSSTSGDYMLDTKEMFKDFENIDSKIKNLYNQTGTPVTNDKIIGMALNITSGDLDQALILTRDYYVYKVRYGGDLEKNIKEFRTMVLDEFSSDISWADLSYDHPPKTYEGLFNSKTGMDFDLSNFNRVGGAYHTVNLVILARYFDPVIVFGALVQDEFYAGETRGIGKTITDVTATKDLYEIDSYLNQFDPDSPRPWPPACRGKQ